jgi:hypothetical protein
MQPARQRGPLDSSLVTAPCYHHALPQLDEQGQRRGHRYSQQTLTIEDHRLSRSATHQLSWLLSVRMWQANWFGDLRRATARAVAAREHEFFGHHLSPLSDATLQGSQLAIFKLVGVLLLKSLEQQFGCRVWFLLKPHKDFGPHCFKRIPSGSPVPWFATCLAMCRARLT